MEQNQIENQNTAQKGKVSDLVILIIAVVTLVFSIVVMVVLMSKKSDPVPPEATLYKLSELHDFPAIDFADTLYYKKVLTSYSQGEEESPRDVYYYEVDSLGEPTTVKVHETSFYPNASKYIDGNISENQRDGLWYAYHKNGNVQTMAHYRQGKEDGRYTVYYENGNVRYTGFYKEGKRVGKWCFYDEEENFVRSEDFDE